MGFPDFVTEKSAWIQCDSFLLDPDLGRQLHQLGRAGKGLSGFRNRNVVAGAVGQEAYSIPLCQR